MQRHLEMFNMEPAELLRALMKIKRQNAYQGQYYN